MAESGGNDVASKYEYDPKHFLKCHSRIKGDSHDRITKVWMCAFAPHPKYPEKSSNLIATCGSNSINVIDVSTGEVVTKYYSKESDEEFFSVSWTTLSLKEKGSDKRISCNILAAAGAKCTLHLLHPDEKFCFFEKKHKSRKKVAINSVQFHPLARTILCGGFSNGTVHIWDLGEVTLPEYEVKLSILHTISIENEIFSLTFSRHCETLLASTDNGVVAWTLGLKDLNGLNVQLKCWQFNFPKNPNGSDDDHYQLVDSVEPIQNGKIMATKCALYGVIYLWDLQEALQKSRMGGSVSVQPDHILNYSKTDNYFMSMGSSLLSGLLCCGDDNGNLWLYDLKEILAQSHEEHLQSAVIPWPIVRDRVEDSMRMVKLNEVVINKVAVNHSGSYIVAVTNTNLVCIWKRD